MKINSLEKLVQHRDQAAKSPWLLRVDGQKLKIIKRVQIGNTVISASVYSREMQVQEPGAYRHRVFCGNTNASSLGNNSEELD